MRIQLPKTVVCLVALVLTSGTAQAAAIPYDYSASLSNGITVSGRLLVDETNPGYAPGGTVEFVSGGITAFRFTATNGSVTESIDTQTIPVPTPQTMRLTFSNAGFPAVEAWDVSCSNESSPLFQFVTVKSPSNSGYEQWAGEELNGSRFPSGGAWTRIDTNATGCYDFAATLSNGVEITGSIVVDTGAPDYTPGGVVDFYTGEILSFRFRATDGAISEEINSELIAVPTPQTVRFTFSTTAFPAIEAWDISCSNEGSPLYQFVTVKSPTNSGYEQWAGEDINGGRFPSGGVWTAGCAESPVPVEESSWSVMKARGWNR